jgi:hypothetical protein
MASLLNNASLLLNPAGSIIAYEEDKIFSVLPSNGTGDFTFSGGDGGTRVNQQGYIESTPANFMLNSGTTWGSQGVTIVTGIDDPVGGFGAYAISNIDPGSITDYAFKNGNTMPISAGTIITYSVYMRGTGTIATYLERGVSGTYWFNTKVHTLDPNEWKLFTHTYTVPTDASGVNTYVGNESGTTSTYVQVAFPSLNYGSTAKPYQPTTDRLNYPRITYQNGRGALLSEPQRTNLALQSNIFPVSGAPGNNNGLYFYNLATLNSTNNLSPDGTNNAYNITMHDSSFDMYSTFTGLSVGTTYCYSLYVKLGSATNFSVVVNNTAAWNTVAGSQTFTNLNDTNYTRATITFVAPSTGQVNIHLGGHSEAITQQSSGDVYIWGEQFEAGTFPTSYIPTTSATVTRPLDQYSVTNLESNGLTGTNVGTLYLSVANTANSYDGGTINAKVGGGGNFPFNYMILDSTGTANRVRIFNGSTQTGTYFYDGFFSKIAVTADGTNSSVFVNGIKKGTSAGLTAGIEEITQEAFGAGLRYTTATYTTALSDAQCQELTTVRSGSGGNISYYGPYTVHTFTGSATFTPSFNGQVEVLVVAGGGGGGANHGGGGGGAGGLLYTSAYGVSAGSGITVTVGSGGAIAGNGSNSVFGGLTTIGGGLGASEGANNGGNGGSGGGGTGFSTATNGGLGTPGQGFDGGKGGFPDTSAVYGSGGGGGGASAPGTDGKEGQNVSGSAGNGGDGLPYSINGFSTYYAGGGGGGYWGDNLTYYGVGGLGGGGNGGAGGSASTLLPTPGVNGLGGGGGGARGDGSLPRPGSVGGSGIVIVRYLT